MGMFRAQAQLGRKILRVNVNLAVCSVIGQESWSRHIYDALTVQSVQLHSTPQESHF